MSEGMASGARPADPVGRYLYAITRPLTVFGGILFCLMALLTTVSIVGRSFFDAPVMGDFELVAIGTGLGIFAFLPHCQLMRENVIVDFFMAGAPLRVKAFFDTLGSVMFGAIMTFVAWRMYYGTLDMYEVGETSMILGIPRWWGFPFAVACLVLLVIVCVYTTVRSARDMSAPSSS